MSFPHAKLMLMSDDEFRAAATGKKPSHSRAGELVQLHKRNAAPNPACFIKALLKAPSQPPHKNSSDSTNSCNVLLYCRVTNMIKS